MIRFVQKADTLVSIIMGQVVTVFKHYGMVILILYLFADYVYAIILFSLHLVPPP